MLSYSLVVLDVLAAVLLTVTVMTMIAGLRWPRMSWVLAGFACLSAAGLLALALHEVDESRLVLAAAFACLMLGLAVGVAREQRGDTADSELQAHLTRCRRRGETASFLVVALSDPMRKNAAEALRVTDTAVVRRVGKRWELQAVLDQDDVPRRIIEERLDLVLAGAAPVFGWATFPADGLTLETLFEHARAETRRAVTATAARPRDDRFRTPDDPAAAT